MWPRTASPKNDVICGWPVGWGVAPGMQPASVGNGEGDRGPDGSPSGADSAGGASAGGGGGGAAAAEATLRGAAAALRSLEAFLFSDAPTDKTEAVGAAVGVAASVAAAAAAAPQLEPAERRPEGRNARNAEVQGAGAAGRRAERAHKADLALAKLRRCQTLVDSTRQGSVLRLRTYVPSAPPPGHRLAEQLVTTAITRVAPAAAATIAKAAAGASAGAGAGAELAGPCDFVVEHTVRQPTLEHVQYFWDRPSFRGLGTDVFADVKEITESVAAYRAALKVHGFARSTLTETRTLARTHAHTARTLAPHRPAT